MDRYTARINLHGTTDRERALNIAKIDLSNRLPRNPSYKLIKIDGIDSSLIIDSESNVHYKAIKSMPNKVFYAGQIVDFANSKYLITEADSDGELYVDGKMEECNYLLKWQDASGNIIERWCITESDESLGVDGNRTVPLGDGKMNIIIPYDSETIKIRKDKRFYIDNNLTDPIPYKVTNASTTSNVRNGHGYLTFVVSEGQTIPEKDRPDLMLCNYISPTVTPTPSQDESVISSFITGVTTLKIGYAKTYTVAFTDASGNTLTDVSFTWNVVSDFDSAITKTISGQSITLKVSDDTYVGKTITLQVVIDGTVNSSAVITVKPLL